MPTVIHGDCLEVLRTFESDSIDALVTDPPSSISFMNKKWDHDKGGRDQWVGWLTEIMAECLRVLRPGGHGLVWGIPRRAHWTMMSLEDAGFEIRDVITHLQGQGFPKSLDISKAIDKMAGAEREVVGKKAWTSDAGMQGGNFGAGNYARERQDITAPATDAAKQWAGWGSALKPSAEYWVFVRKPLAEKSIAAQVLATGTGGINIGAARIAHRSEADAAESSGKNQHADFGTAAGANRVYGDYSMVPPRNYDASKGRWPPNTIPSESAAQAIDSQSGGASRFFPVLPDPPWLYTPKAPTRERPVGPDGTKHPCVKSIALMSWLTKLVCPPGGIVLDPFAGSGATLEAALLEGFDCIGIEAEASYIPLIEQRLARVS